MRRSAAPARRGGIPAPAGAAGGAPAPRGAARASPRSRRSSAPAPRSRRCAAPRGAAPGCAVGTGDSAAWNSSSCSFSPGRSPMNSIAMSLSGRSPARRIICRARSTILTGSPMSSTKILPRASASSAAGDGAEASSTSSTASRTVMKNRLTSGWVTVSGPPAASWRVNSGTTEPVEPSTLPNRTVTNRVPASPRAARLVEIERLAEALGEPLGGAHHAGRVDRLVGRDHHHQRRAEGARRLGDVAAADDVGQHALDRVGLDHRHDASAPAA